MQHDAMEPRLQNWGAFRHSMHFLHFSPWKYPQNVSRRDATSVHTPIPSKISVQAGGVTHMRTQKLGAFRPCWHLVTVQTRGVGLGCDMHSVVVPFHKALKRQDFFHTLQYGTQARLQN